MITAERRTKYHSPHARKRIYVRKHCSLMPELIVIELRLNRVLYDARMHSATNHFESMHASAAPCRSMHDMQALLHAVPCMTCKRCSMLHYGYVDLRTLVLSWQTWSSSTFARSVVVKTGL